MEKCVGGEAKAKRKTGKPIKIKSEREDESQQRKSWELAKEYAAKSKLSQ